MCASLLRRVFLFPAAFLFVLERSTKQINRPSVCEIVYFSCTYRIHETVDAVSDDRDCFPIMSFLFSK